MLAFHEIVGITGLLTGSGAAFCLRTSRWCLKSWRYLLCMTFSCMTFSCVAGLYTTIYDWNLTMFLCEAFWLMFNLWYIFKWKILNGIRI